MSARAVTKQKVQDYCNAEWSWTTTKAEVAAFSERYVETCQGATCQDLRVMVQFGFFQRDGFSEKIS